MQRKYDKNFTLMRWFWVILRIINLVASAKAVNQRRSRAGHPL